MNFDLKAIIKNFQLEGNCQECISYGNGHINDTYLATMDNGVRYILQRINHFVFKKPLELMDNVKRVTEHITKKVELAGGDPNRESLQLFKTLDGEICYIDPEGNHWRVYLFIIDAIGYDLIDNPKIAFQGGLAYGQFQTLLVDLSGGSLFETIPNFNHPPHLLDRFNEVLKKDAFNRAKDVSDAVEFVLSRAYEMQKLVRMGKDGTLPFRITHNDTKINNVLIDTKTNIATCVIDLDTVMSGFALNDYGDSIRTGANKASEDEIDLSKVGIDMEMFTLYTTGYLTKAKAFLTENEKNNMAFSVKLYPYLIGLRFITDYLEGDVYFKIHRDHHNLQRAKSQFQLVSNIESKFDLLVETIEKIYNSIEV